MILDEDGCINEPIISFRLLNSEIGNDPDL